MYGLLLSWERNSDAQRRRRPQSVILMNDEQALRLALIAVVAIIFRLACITAISRS